MSIAEKQPATASATGRFMVAGIAGFGVGGALGGLVQFALRAPAYRSPVLASLIATLGFTVLGIVGAAALGLAARDSRLLRRLVVTAVLGFGVGGLLSLLLIVTMQADLSALPPVPRGDIPGQLIGFAALMYLFAFAIRGAIGGALLGVAVPNRHAVRLLAVLGALGFGIGGAAGVLLLNAPPWSPLPLPDMAIYALWLAVSAIPGGVALGWGMGLLARSWRRS